MFISGTDSLFGNCLYIFFEEKYSVLRCVHWRKILAQAEYHDAHTIILNFVSQEQSHAELVSYLNNGRGKVHNKKVVVVTESSLARVCIELLCIDNVIVLTDESPLCDFHKMMSIAHQCLYSRKLFAKKILSRRERQILSLLVAGYSPIEISESMELNYKTIQTYKMKIISKLSLRNTTDLNKLIVMFHRYQ